MEQILRLNWPRCRDGYDLIQFDSRKVDWTRYERDEDANQPQLAKNEQRFLHKWGPRLRLSEPGDEQEYWFLERSERMLAPDILAKEPQLFSKLAAIKDDAAKISDFVSNYGLPFIDAPCSQTHVQNHARLMHELIKGRKSKTRTKTSNWLKRTVEQFRRGLDGDIHILPEMREGRIQLILEPNDLGIAMLLQFIFHSTRDLEINQCECCGRYITKGPYQSRRDRKYCSNSCKQRDYRKRKQM